MFTHLIHCGAHVHLSEIVFQTYSQAINFSFATADMSVIAYVTSQGGDGSPSGEHAKGRT